MWGESSSEGPIFATHSKRFTMRAVFLCSLLTIAIAGCNNQGNNDSGENKGDVAPVSVTPIIPYTIINTYPHDTAYFTEGLEFYNGHLYESSGGNLSESPYPSAIGIVNLQTGKNETKITLDRSRYFGEGITFFRGELYQLTWRSGTGFVYHAGNFKKIKEFRIPSPEGWGLTHDSTQLYMSDGSSNIYVLQPDSLRILRTITVNDESGPVSNINELEYVNGIIYANQWLSPYILRIDPSNGKVTGKLDLTAISSQLESRYPGLHELNGIAYNAANNSFFIAGKKWPLLYEIRLR